MNLQRLDTSEIIGLISVDVWMVSRRTRDQTTLDFNMDFNDSKLLAQISILCAVI